MIITGFLFAMGVFFFLILLCLLPSLKILFGSFLLFIAELLKEDLY